MPTDPTTVVTNFWAHRVNQGVDFKDGIKQDPTCPNPHQNGIIKLKAFLSHSSQDKAFVDQVYNTLGAAQAHLDSATFEKARINIEAIHSALEDSDIFVLFLSEDSLASSFVSHESILALEQFASGKLHRIMILCIDEVNLDLIDERLRNLNIVTQVGSVGSCARHIQSALVEISLSSSPEQVIFVGREAESKNLRKALTRASSESPAVVVLSGIDGVGRKTLIQRVFRELLPPFSRFAKVNIKKNQGIDDLFRSLVRLRGRTTIRQARNELLNFADVDHQTQISLLHEEIAHILDESETLLLIDYGGIMDEEGAYHDYILETFKPFHSYSRPCAVFVQQRMPPFGKRKNLKSYHFERVPPLSAEETQDLLGARLRSEGLTFTAGQIDRLEGAVSQHPINVDFAMDSISNLQGDLDLFLSDPSDLLVWRNRRALDFLNQVSFTSEQQYICGLLISFTDLTSEHIMLLVEESAEVVAGAIRVLLDRHIIERDNGYYVLSAPIIDAMGRSGNFHLSKEEEQRAATKLLDTLEAYRDRDEVQRALLEPAVIASLRTGGALKSQWRQLVLPSHYLVVAREAYDQRNLPRTVQFCRQALEHASRMSEEAKVECYRMLGLSAVRTSDEELLRDARDGLASIGTRYSKQVNLFLKGFSSRYKGFFSDAEVAYLKCFDINERNFSVCRELAQVYLALGRPDEAENYARTAFEIAPNNPFIIDILVGVLVGRARMGGTDLNGDRELSYLLSELKKYGHAEGKSFYSNRMAECAIMEGNPTRAKQYADEAVKLAEWLIPPYITRAIAYLMKGNEAGARRDVDSAKRMSKENASYGNLYGIELFELEIDIMVSRRRYRQAKNLLDRISENKIPGPLFVKLERKIANAVKFDQDFHDADVIDWVHKKL